MKSYMKLTDGSVTTPSCFLASGISCGLKRSGAPDMAMIYSTRPCAVAGAFTSNLFAAAPVEWDRGIVSSDSPVFGVVVNSGNANACTGVQGLSDAKRTAAEAARMMGVLPEQMLVSSTGRIGVPMPMDVILKGVELCVKGLSDDGGAAAARAIMTTDTVPKHLAVSLELSDGTVIRLGAMTKGAGMIAPKLRMEPPQATMLCYVTTDACISQAALRAALSRAIGRSFNRITVDGDTSTNDTVIVLANGAAGNRMIEAGAADFEDFSAALEDILGELARKMVLDGEGVSKFVEVNVIGAASEQDAKTCAEAIANSALCKTAWFGADPNWGRILCAAGYCGISFDPARVNLDYDGIPVVRGGMDAGTSEKKLVEVLKRREWRMDLDLQAGSGSYTVWTCDLTYDYVKINADYHT